MKLIIVAGGGGHFAPALAVIEVLPKDTSLLVLGRKYSLEGDRAISLEYQTAKKRGIPFVSVTTGRLQRRFSLSTLLSLFKLPIGLYQSFQTLSKFKPDVLLSFGGYVSVPVVIVAFLLKIPIVIHEQTLGAGLSNKIASFFAKKICISWRQSSSFFPESKSVLTGNPVRSEIKNPKKGTLFRNHPLFFSRKEPLLYVTGGSSGSHAINKLVEEALPQLLSRFRVLHQTGDAKEFNDFERLEELAKTLSLDQQKRYLLTKFIDSQEVGAVLAEADVVISRSGMNTITELLVLSKKAILIPLPNSAGNEQYNNAMFLKEIGLASVFRQSALTGDLLYNTVHSKLLDKQATEKTEDSDIILTAEKNILKVVLEVYERS